MESHPPPAADSGSRWRRRPYLVSRKLGTVLGGLRTAIANDFSVAYKVALSLSTMGLALYLRHWIDLAMVAIVTALALSAELFNTAIESLCDYVEPRHDPRIGAIKDISAAGTAVAILVWWLVIAWEFAFAVSIGLGAIG